MICPSCSSRNPQGARFCRSCGASLDLGVEPEETGTPEPAAQSDSTFTVEGISPSKVALLRTPSCVVSRRF
jgi:hypothetical protein